MRTKNLPPHLILQPASMLADSFMLLTHEISPFFPVGSTQTLTRPTSTLPKTMEDQDPLPFLDTLIKSMAPPSRVILKDLHSMIRSLQEEETGMRSEGKTDWKGPLWKEIN